MAVDFILNFVIIFYYGVTFVAFLKLTAKHFIVISGTVIVDVE